MKRYVCMVMLILFSYKFTLEAQVRSVGRSKVSFDSGWLFQKDSIGDAILPNVDSFNWQPVQLPHTWNDKDVLADGKRGYYRGIAWYKKSFRLVPESERQYFLQFEGSNQVTEVFVNGKFAGKHIGGYSSFNVELTPFLNLSGEQYISVKVDNSFDKNIPPLSADFTFFGGIYRPVHLITTGNKHFSMSDYGGPGIYISTTKVSEKKAEVTIEYYLQNKSNQKVKLSLETSIKKDTESVLAEKRSNVTIEASSDMIFKVTFKNVENFELWSTEKPVVYYVESSLKENGKTLDNLTQPLGFRWFSFDANKGFFLNGKNVKLIGANRHQDRIPYGNALSDDMHRQDMQLLKEMGANFLRNAHYPQATEILDNSDQLGFVVWEEIPLVNEVNVSEEHNQNAGNMLKEMIKQHYNHPSIFIWAYMNEIYWAHRFKPEQEIPIRNKATLELTQRLENLTRQTDPYRYTAIAMHNYPLYDESGIGDIPMIAGWNLYHGWYYDKYEDFGKYMDEQHKKYPNRIHFISEYGAGSDVRLYSEKPEKFDFTMEEQVRFIQSLTSQIIARPYISGGAIWNLVDFSSERRVDATSHMNNKGLVTHNRKPKDAYFLMQALLSEKPVATFGYPFRTDWKHIATSPSDTLVPVRMYAFSNREKLSLLINNQFHSVSQTRNGMAVWDLSLPEGKYVFSLQENGKNIQNKSIQTKLIPYQFKTSKEIDIAMNLGANYAFIDSRTGQYWLPEKEYSEGSFGFIGGKQLYVGDKIGTKEDILAVDEEDPLYQAIRVGMSEFRADVPEGVYEVEVLMVEYVPKSRRFADEDKEVTRQPNKRIFSIFANESLIEENLDLGANYGLNVPYRLVFKTKVTKDNGLSIKFQPIKGEPVVSGIRVRGVGY
ncbi:glycoside hydrolase family 2 TIM barrel-domain containing protein [Capnocytophaga cynodegmi]|uniref:glycoside hydrolase family 2 TIM barrel-domain containing protein n=1 Tax=Capnocytophaga cynodegmi TaxID=28189 RepID=UPI0021005BB5|nr:glycoside hydrolase family 2 TIM barrel-domain containing protein [Capnocytophaga cynodegmi]